MLRLSLLQHFVRRPGALSFPPCSRYTGAAAKSAVLWTSLRGFFGAQQPDYYKILGVPASATADEIKAAYKKLALQFHPDRNKAADAEEKFKQISEAYSVVGNKTKRKDYDASRMYGNPGFASSGQAQYRREGSSSSSSSSSTTGGANYGPNFGTQYRSNPFEQHTQQQGTQQQYTAYSQQMSKEDAEKLFRELFGGMQVDQIFREFERSMGSGSPRMSTFGGGRRMQDFAPGEGTFRPFFREEAANVYTDAHGNRTEERTFTTSDGTRYTVHNRSSTQEGASMNQTAEEYYRAHTDQRNAQDGRAQFGTASFRPRQPNMDFGRYFGVRTHGRHPVVGILILVAWAIILTTLVFGVLGVALSHPIFVLALLFLYFARRGRF